ncbi:histidine kinase [Pseudomonas abyssi]|uniref:sensor histidine kinase n=1 Tax=Pseudomonas abyssi TaxID=170540 RepID=UPI003C7E3B88
MKTLPLAARLYTGVLLAFAVMLLSLLLVLLQQAEKDLVRELHASRALALQLFDGLSRSPTSPDPHQFDGLRHLRISRVGEALPATTAEDVPRWLVNWLQPAVDERFPPLTLSFNDGSQWHITPDPHDELGEIWESVQLLLLVFAAALAVSLLAIHWALGRGQRAYQQLLGGLHEVASGRFSTRLAASQQPELNHLAERFNAMTGALQQAEQRNQNLTQRLLSVQEDERTQLAHALHDDLGQYLTGIRAQTFMLQHSRSGSPEQVEQLSQQLLASCDGLQQGFRALVRDLHPVVLQRLGLEQALAQLTEQWQVQHGIDCRLLLTTDLPELAPDARAHLYRLVQEALNNVARHARATQVQIWLGCVGDQLVVRIEDDGCGLEQGSVWGIGMHSMHERARCLGAVLHLRSAEQSGLILELSIPWRQAA